MVELAQVVEAELRARQRAQLLGDHRVASEVAQQIVADAMVGDAPQLLLGRNQ